MQNLKFFMMGPEGVAKELNTDIRNGLTEEKVKISRDWHGINELTAQRGKSFIRRVMDAMLEPMTIILILAASITIGVNISRLYTGGETDFIECVGIIIAILLSTSITILMEGHSEKAFQALQKIQDNSAIKTIRDGKAKIIPLKELVVGDIIELETGDRIPADCYIISSSQLTSDEASLTGESIPVNKEGNTVIDNPDVPLAEQINMLFFGCYITTGFCRAIVTAVGDRTELGKIAHALKTTSKQTTPLQEKLEKLGKNISLFAIGAAVLIFIIQIIQKFLGLGGDLLLSEIFITSIALIVAAVPEGLPTIVAISLAMNVIKMAKENALVRKMVACETVGAVNIICSDKTGTLTQNKMEVVGYYDTSWHSKMEENISQYLIDNICINSSADIDIQDKEIRFLGNPTESAMLAFYQCSCVAHSTKKSYCDRKKDVNILKVFPFSSEEKHMTTVIEKDGETIAYVKGSPEKIISMCRMDSATKYQIELEIFKSQEKAMRVIAFAHKILQTDNINSLEEEAGHNEMESNMEFDGFVTIYDPLRPEVAEAVKTCRMAGIDIKILTGDHVVTARAIANELNLLTSESLVLTAAEIDEMDDEKLGECIDRIAVIARSTPNVKLRIVKMLRERKNTVAVTGDGVNDAPAIKNADVGIAMGIAGTEVSREAADIVLLNDSFATIAKAIQWGRNIYQNFQRFISFQLTVNVSAVLTVFIFVALGYPAPFGALELLWINIIMDGPPALTLGLEPVRSNLMKDSPINRTENIITRGLWFKIASIGLAITAMMFIQVLFNVLGGTKEQQPTILFNLFVLFHLWNAFNCREINDQSIIKNIMLNKPMILVFAITFAIQITIVQYFGIVFKVIPLPIEMWLKILAYSFCVILISEIGKFIWRRI